jgi:PAS domain S-box-containing protein
MFVFSIQLLAAVGVVGGLSFHHGQQAIEKMAQQLSLSVSHEIEHHLTTDLNQPPQLSQLSQSLQNLQLTDSVKAVILDGDGTAIAASNLNQESIPSISDVAIAHLNQNYSSLQDIDPLRYYPFEFEGKQQLLHILPVNNSYGLDWFVMVAIEITDFSDAFGEQSQLTIFLCGIILGLMVTLALLTARWISAPLERLSEAADAIKADQPPPPFEPTAIKELNRLGDCFHQMVQQLKQTQQVNEDRVEERTQQLNALNQKFAQVFGYSPVAMCISRIADGYILDVNEAFTYFLGYSREQAIGYTSQDLNIWVDLADRNQLIEQLPSLGSIAHYETQMRTQSGEVIDVEIFGTTIEVDHQPCLLLAGSDLTQRKRGETERDLYENRLQMQQIVMMELSKSTELQAGDLKVALKKLTMMIAHLLDIDRVSIWFYNDNKSQLRCANLYQLHSRQHSSNQTLLKTDVPHYFNAIATQSLIVVDNIETHPHLQDLYVSYLKPLGVTARLDVAICSEGKTVGILSLEQIHRPRQWLLEEQNFAAYFAHLIALAIEARDHAEAEAALRQSEQRFRQLAENIENVFWMVDPQTQEILYISPAYEKIWGRCCEELYASRDAFLEAIYPDDRSIIISTKTQNVHQPQEIEYRIIRPDGEIRWIRDRAFPVYNDSGELYRVAGIAEDVTQDKQAQAALRRSQERLQLALEAAENGLWDWNLITGELYISPQALQMLGYCEEEFTGLITQWQEIIHPLDKPWVLERLNQHLTQNSGAYAFDYRLRTRGGQWKWMANYGKVVERDAQGNPVRMTGVQQDITERKKVEEKLQNSLREKEVLLREIHHRVKNNLHIISSLLDLQSDTLENEQLVEMFADSQNRIRSMALIHEQLYQSPDLGQVEFGEYIHRLMNNLFFSFGENINNIQPIIEVDSVYLNIETAIPCGLLINEIVTNAFKHAFSQSSSGKIHVQFSQQDQQLKLIISDNGKGIPNTIEWQKSSSLGLRLVKILSQQLKAKVQTDFSQGTYFQFIFLPLEYKQRF